jgi:predicted aspartyl protease
MTEKTALPLTYNYTHLQKRIITPVYLYGVSATGPKDTATDALWDTGATLSAITPRIQRELGLVPIGTRSIRGVTDIREVNVVILTIELPNNILKKNVVVAVCDFSSTVGALIGMDIITLGDFALLHGGGRTVFSFTTPPRTE